MEYDVHCVAKTRRVLSP